MSNGSTVLLGSVATARGGTGFPERLQGGSDGIPFIKVSDMNLPGNERFIHTANNYVSLETARQLGARVFEKGDIVFAKVGAALLLNRRRVLTGPTLIDNNLMAISPLSVDGEFLLQLLLNFDMADLVQVGALPSINQSQVHSIQIPEFTPEEQRGIAEVLSALDEQIETTEALVQKKSLAKIGLCDLLLSGSSRHQTQPLSHYIAGLESGVSVNSDDRQKQGNEVGVLKTSCVFGGKFFPAEHKAIWAKDTARAKLNPIADSIIISRMNTPELVGESGFVEVGATDLFLPDRLWQTVKNNSVKSDFRWLAQVLQWGPVRKAIKDQATGTSNSMKNISKAAFLGVHVPALTFDEQLIATEVLLAADAEIDLLKQEIEKLKFQKQGLMHDLLTGKTRVLQ